MEKGDVDRYIEESVKSYRCCKAKNSARRSSLQRKTLGIEAERRLAAASMSKEERQLRESLKQMKIDKAKNVIVHNMRERRSKPITKSLREKNVHGDGESRQTPIPIEPYPVTLCDSPRTSPKLSRGKTSIEELGREYTRTRGRRLSKEFEDLCVNTETGKLKKKPNMAKRLLVVQTLKRPKSSSLLSLRKSDDSFLLSRSTDVSDTSSSSAMSSLEDLHWIGDPEATKSVRRARKTVSEQELSSEIHKLSKHSK